MREGDTDPTVVMLRQDRQFWHFNLGHLITIIMSIIPLTVAGVWWGGVLNTKLDNLTAETAEFKRADVVAHIAHTDSEVAALGGRIAAIEANNIPDRVAATDHNVTQLTQKLDDLVKRLDDNRDERVRWQTDVSGQLRDLLSKTSKLEAHQDSRKGDK